MADVRCPVAAELHHRAACRQGSTGPAPLPGFSVLAVDHVWIQIVDANVGLLLLFSMAVGTVLANAGWMLRKNSASV